MSVSTIFVLFEMHVKQIKNELNFAENIHNTHTHTHILMQMEQICSFDSRLLLFWEREREREKEIAIVVSSKWTTYLKLNCYFVMRCFSAKNEKGWIKTHILLPQLRFRFIPQNWDYLEKCKHNFTQIWDQFDNNDFNCVLLYLFNGVDLSFDFDWLTVSVWNNEKLYKSKTWKWL